MADQQRDGGKEPLTEREALQELARAIVRESESARDPEQEAWLEANKLQLEMAKTMVLVASGALVSIATITGILPAYVNAQLLALALVMIFASLTVSFSHMRDVANSTAAQRYAPDSPWLAIGYGLLCGGLLVFALYVLYNLPFETGQGDPASVKEKTDLLTGNFKLVVVGAILAFGPVIVLRLVRRRRTSSRRTSRRASDRESQRRGGA